MAKLPIEAVADASQAKSELDSLGQTGSQSMEGIGVAGIALGNILSDVVMKGVELVKDAFVGMAEATAEWVSMSNAQEDAVNLLNAGLKSTGQFTEELSQRYQDLAGDLQKVSLAGDEELLPLMQRLITVGGVTEDQMERVSMAALDMAAGTGKDAAMGFDLMAKAAAGNVEALKRYLPELESTGDETRDFAAALDLIESKFAGLAEAQTQTFSGQMNQLAKRVGDAKESLGDMIKEGLEPLVPVLENLVTKGEEFIEKYGEEIGEKLKAVGETVADLTTKFGDFMAAHNDEIIMAAANALKLLVDAGTGAVKVAAWLIESYGDARLLFAEFLETLRPVVGMLAVMADTVGATGMSQVLLDLHTGLEANTKAQADFAEKTRALGQAATEAADALAVQFKGGIDSAANALQGMTEKQDLVGLKGEELVAALRNQGGATEELAASTAQANEQLDEFGRVIIIPQIPETTENIKEAAASTDQLAGSLAKAKTKTDDLIMSIKDNSVQFSDLARAAQTTGDGLALASDSSVYFAKTLNEAGSAGGAMGQAVAAGAAMAKGAIQAAVVFAKKSLADLHAGAVASANAARDVFADLSFTAEVGGGTGERADIEGGRLEQMLSRIKGATEQTPGFFRNITQSFATELAGGADVGKLEAIFKTFMASQRAVQTATNRADLTGTTASDMRGIEQIMAQQLAELKRLTATKIDGPSLAGEIRNILDRGEARA